MREINGKVALVTGGGSGIGRALAKALAAEGASLVVADIVPDTARDAADEIVAEGGTALGIVCDVSDRAAVVRMKDEVNAAYGAVSLLFANAGATSFERLTDMSNDDVDWIIQANLMSVVNCLTAFLPDMVSARDGHVFATASMAGVVPGWIPYHAPYSAAKMGIIGMMLNVRQELAEFGVGSSVLCPGGVATGMKENNARYRPERFGGPGDGPVVLPGGVARLFADVQLAFRPPEDVARMVLRAVRENRPIVVTDPKDREIFVETYVNPVLAAFEDVETFERDVREAGHDDVS